MGKNSSSGSLGRFSATRLLAELDEWAERKKRMLGKVPMEERLRQARFQLVPHELLEVLRSTYAGGEVAEFRQALGVYADVLEENGLLERARLIQASLILDHVGLPRTEEHYQLSKEIFEMQSLFGVDGSIEGAHRLLRMGLLRVLHTGHDGFLMENCGQEHYFDEPILDTLVVQYPDMWPHNDMRGAYAELLRRTPVRQLKKLELKSRHMTTMLMQGWNDCAVEEGCGYLEEASVYLRSLNPPHARHEAEFAMFPATKVLHLYLSVPTPRDALIRIDWGNRAFRCADIVVHSHTDFIVRKDGVAVCL